MHRVEVAGAVDIDPGRECPGDGRNFLMVLGKNMPGRLVGECMHVIHQAPSGIAAEFELPGFGMPAAVVRLGDSTVLCFMRQNTLPQQCVELRTILPSVRDERRREDVRVPGL